MSSTSDEVYDVIVIGAGVEGSATAYYLTSRYTNNVLLLEQFSVGHTRGSSHGGSRITRKAYHKTFYTKMMDTAFKMWSDIEEESNRKIYYKTGILIFGNDDVKNYINALQVNNHPHTVMSGKEANKKYPRQLKLPDNYLCVTEDNGGILQASPAVAALQFLVSKNGGKIMDSCKVLRVSPGGDSMVTVTTARGTFKSRKVILATGAWTNELLEPLGLKLPLKVIRTEVLYWPVKDSSHFDKEAFPCFIYTEGSDHCYGLPVHEYPNLFKVCFHDGLELSSPDKRDAVPCGTTGPIMSNFIQKHFKDVETTPAIMEMCMYTNTPDGDPVLDTHPLYPNIIIGAGFSGQGFKIAPVVGQILSELALNMQPSHDISPFKIKRFEHLKSSL